MAAEEGELGKCAAPEQAGSQVLWSSPESQSRKAPGELESSLTKVVTKNRFQWVVEGKGREEVAVRSVHTFLKESAAERK